LKNLNTLQFAYRCKKGDMANLLAKSSYKILTVICMLSIMATLVPLTQAGSNIYVYDSQFGGSGTGNGKFSYPIAIAMDSSGNIYITDQNNRRVQKFDSNGNYQLQFGSGYFDTPQGIAISPTNGYIYVADNYYATIFKFDSNGAYIGQIGGFATRATGVAFDSSGNLYVTSWYDKAVYKFDSSDHFLTSWGGFSSPIGVTVDHNNNVYVADVGSNNIKKFSTSGTLIATIGTAGSGDGQFSYPMYIGVDSSNNIYVPEQDGQRVQKFDSSGNFLTKWGSMGTGDGEFMFPYGVLAHSNGKIYVCDLYNNRVQIFKEQALVVTPEAPWGIAAMVASIAGIIVFGAVQKTRKVTVYPK
jgi:tripartite motif-containing protein 71